MCFLVLILVSGASASISVFWRSPKESALARAQGRTRRHQDGSNTSLPEFGRSDSSSCRGRRGKEDAMDVTVLSMRNLLTTQTEYCAELGRKSRLTGSLRFPV